MEPRELAHRLREKGISELERLGVGLDEWEAPEGRSFKAYLSGAPAQRFYVRNPEHLRKWVQENFPQWIDRALDQVEKLCRHEVEILGYGPVALGAEIDWHRDPVTGRVWERHFWTAYRPEHDMAGRDSKIIHELNRHQHLPCLAKAYLLTGDERYAAEAVAQLESWIEQNPPGLGINWQSSLEIGIRAISWLWTIFLILPSRSLDDASAERIGRSLFSQLEHVNRYTSRYSSPNTHLIGEAAALFIGGLLFRDLKRPAAWLEQGAALLAEEAETQILEDGVHGELSSCYHCYTLDFYLQALALAERNQFPFPERVRRKICEMLRFLMHTTRPDGSLPGLGDDDGGRALALQQKNYRSFNDALCVGAALFQRMDFKHVAGAYFEEALWLLGEEASQVYCLLGSEPPDRTQAFFSWSGYLVQRSGWGPLDSHLIFDCGGLGMLGGGHAHADALSVVLFSRGRELLVDPGTFVYNGAPDWRNYFRSTPAHNTVTIDGRDQAERGGTFRWNTKISCRAAIEPAPPPIEYAEAEHDGYGRLPQGVTHRRRLLHIPAEYWIVLDDFRGPGNHTYDFYYHLAPDVEVSSLERENAQLLLRSEQAGLLLCLHASRPLETEIIRGRTEPIAAWVSSGYGEKKPGATLRAAMAGQAPAAAMTFLSLAAKDPAPRRLMVNDQDVIACCYEHNEFEDLAICSTGESEIVVADLRFQGEFIWLRMQGGVLKQLVAVRTRMLNRGGKDLLEGALCAESVAS